MKKRLVLVLALVLSMSIVGCGKKTEEVVEPTPKVTETITMTPEATPEITATPEVTEEPIEE